jgi:thioredoxin-dependent peroxiredoxin
LQFKKIFGIESFAMLQPGQPAPAFELPDADMQTVALSAFKGKKHVVLYFYPRDGTPGCTLVTTDFSDHEEQFVKHDCVVLGVSRDDCLTHADFRDRHGVTIALLSDTEGEVCRKYGVLQQKQDEAGSPRECLVRSTFIVDKKGVIRHVAYGINPRGHAAEVYDLIKRLRS